MAALSRRLPARRDRRVALPGLPPDGGRTRLFQRRVRARGARGRQRTARTPPGALEHHHRGRTPYHPLEPTPGRARPGAGGARRAELETVAEQPHADAVREQSGGQRGRAAAGALDRGVLPVHDAEL